MSLKWMGFKIGDFIVRARIEDYWLIIEVLEDVQGVLIEKYEFRLKVR